MYAGSLVALVTPMQPDGSIDFDAWTRLLEFHVALFQPRDDALELFQGALEAHVLDVGVV